jgi:hypothetical protein
MELLLHHARMWLGHLSMVFEPVALPALVWLAFFHFLFMRIGRRVFQSRLQVEHPVSTAEFLLDPASVHYPGK